MSTIAYLGPEGTFTDAACAALVDQLEDAAAATRTVAYPTIPAALAAVRDGQADYAVVPYENSVDGPVTPTFDALAQTPRLQILAEQELPIEFSILVRPGTTLAEVTSFATHPVAAAQVTGWLDRNLPGIQPQLVSSTAAAATLVAEGAVDAAAAPARAGVLLGLESLADGVADYRGTVTSFVLVGQPQLPPARTGADRTAVAVEVANAPGMLVTVLTEFASRQVDLARLVARPTKEQFGLYVFLIEVHGHLDAPLLAEALQGVYRHATSVLYLGSWPAFHRKIGVNPPSDHGAADWVARLRAGEDVT